MYKLYKKRLSSRIINGIANRVLTGVVLSSLVLQGCNKSELSNEDYRMHKPIKNKPVLEKFEPLPEKPELKIEKREFELPKPKVKIGELESPHKRTMPLQESFIELIKPDFENKKPEPLADISEQRINDLEAILKKEEHEKHFFQRANYEIISDYYHSYYNNYIDYIAPFSENVRHNLKGLGKEKVVKGYAKLQTLCLDVAFKHKGKKFEEIPREEFTKLGIEMSENQEKNAFDNPFDFSRGFIAGAYAKWTVERVQFFKRLIESGEAGNYEELVKQAFTKEQYKEYLDEQFKSLDIVYDAFEKSLKGPLEKLFGIKEVNTMRREEKRYLCEHFENIYK